MAEYTGHIRAMRADSEFFGAEDLLSLGDVPFQIVRCEHYKNRNACGKSFKELFTLILKDKTGKPCSKEFMLKATNRKTIAALYGANVKDWKEQWLWLYVCEVRSPQGGMTLGIRIQNRKDAPKAAQPNKQQPIEQQPPEDELKSDEELAAVGN